MMRRRNVKRIEGKKTRLQFQIVIVSFRALIQFTNMI